MSRMFEALERAELEEKAPSRGPTAPPAQARLRPIEPALAPHVAIAANPEFARLLYALDAMNPLGKPFVLHFVAATRGEGTSTIAASYAAMAGADRNTPVLLIDCSPSDAVTTPALSDIFVKTGSLDDAIIPSPAGGSVVTARLANSRRGQRDVLAHHVTALLDVARARFPIIILDSPSTQDAPDAVALARHADGTVLVVAAERTRTADVIAARTAIVRHGGQIVGAVLNRHRPRAPRWLERFL